MSREIIININEANKAQKYKDPKEYFQIEAFEDVTKILKEHSVDKNCKDITNCRFHDTIFIDGDRGVGKTAFMVNIEQYYNSHRNENGKDNKFIFLNPIDPTLLEHTEKFLTIVLAKIVEMVNNRFENYCVIKDYYHDNCEMKDYDTRPDDKCKDLYYKALEKLSESLSAIKTMEEDRGIEEIASSKSSLKLEQHSHDFFKVTCKMFGIDSLVMLIDDVDMAFDKGFDVLEVVRKYLASPYLIPIVAGDMNLYKEIVETQFMSKINYQNDLRALNDAQKICDNDKEYYCNTYKKKKDLLNKLVDQYLTKIFPNEYHIKLKDIFRIIKENEVIVKFNDNLQVPFTEIKDFEIRFINLGINQTKFTYQVFSNNTRDLVQYLYSKREIYKEIFGNKEYFPDNYEFNKSHQKYTPQDVMDRYDEILMNFISNDKGLNKKSQDITSQFYEYNEGKQKELSELTYNDVMAYENGNYNIYKAFLGDQFINSKLSIENINNNYSVEYKNFKDVSDSLINIEKFAIDLFIFNDYYTQHQTKNFVFSGKFIEMMIYSLSIDYSLTIDNDISNKLTDVLKSIDYEMISNKEHINIFNDLNLFTNHSNNENLQEVSNVLNNIDINEKLPELYEISNKIPFNSIFTKNNRHIDDSEANEEEDIKDLFDYETTDLNRMLIIWKNVFCTNIKINSLSLYEILNKFFNNLNILKNLNGLKSPLEFMQRIILIFINAVAYFENTNIRIANTNIAVGKDFDFTNILTKTNASTKNIKPLLSVENSLTKALFFHPVIMYILFPHADSKIDKLEFIKNSSSFSESKKFNVLTKDIKRYTEKQIKDVLIKLESYSIKELKQLTTNAIYKNKIMKKSNNFTITELQNKIKQKINND